MQTDLEVRRFAGGETDHTTFSSTTLTEPAGKRHNGVSGFSRGRKTSGCSGFTL